MKNQYINQRGVSLVEILISAVIFSIAALGMFSTLSMMRVSSDVSDKRLGAAYFGRQCLEQLRAKVDQRAYDQVSGDFTNDLSLGNHNCPDDPNGVYTATYTVTIDPTNQSRKVAVTVSWDE